MIKTAVDELYLKKEIAIRKARKSFWAYAQIMANDFYKKDRKYLKTLCDEIQQFYESDEEVLVINLPPRHAKSRTAGLFVEWLLGVNPKLKIMTGSYNELLSTNFSRSVRNAIMEMKADEFNVVYNDIFPHTRINRNHSSVSLWGVEGEPYSYLATSPSGTATGFGANVLVIDDLIKNAREAFNARALSDHWEWFTQTMLSRLEEGGKIFIVMTRWHNDDLAGRAVRHFTEEGKRIRKITMKALQDDGTMLCDDILSYESYQSRIKAMGAEVAQANYQQEPMDIKGRLYTSIKTYNSIPDNIDRISSYTDTADAGKDYLASFIYAVTTDKEAYIIDVVYTKEPMEITEPLLAKKLHENNVNIAIIESNAGGRGFGRSVENILKTKHGSNKARFQFKHQSKNKVARILSNSTWVMDNIYFPENWADRWTELHADLMKFQKEGKNEHDDAPDALTGVAESIQSHQVVNLFQGGF